MRLIVSDWSTEGFDPAFTLAAYEDAEFAYRMMEKRDPGMRLLYTSASVGTHHHPFSVDSFMNRQTDAGMMAKVFGARYALLPYLETPRGTVGDVVMCGQLSDLTPKLLTGA